MAVKEKTPFAVYTQDQVQTGMPPYVIWETSPKMLAAKFYRKYKVHTLKVVPVKFDPDTANWVETK